MCCLYVIIHLICADLKESMEYLTKKYGDKEKDHVTLVRAFSSATEKVCIGLSCILIAHIFNAPGSRDGKRKRR